MNNGGWTIFSRHAMHAARPRLPRVSRLQRWALLAPRCRQLGKFCRAATRQILPGLCRSFLPSVPAEGKAGSDSGQMPQFFHFLRRQPVWPATCFNRGMRVAMPTSVPEPVKSGQSPAGNASAQDAFQQALRNGYGDDAHASMDGRNSGSDASHSSHVDRAAKVKSGKEANAGVTGSDVPSPPSLHNIVIAAPGDRFSGVFGGGQVVPLVGPMASAATPTGVRGGRTSFSAGGEGNIGGNVEQSASGTEAVPFTHNASANAAANLADNSSGNFAAAAPAEDAGADLPPGSDPSVAKAVLPLGDLGISGQPASTAVAVPDGISSVQGDVSVPAAAGTPPIVAGPAMATNPFGTPPSTPLSMPPPPTPTTLAAASPIGFSAAASIAKRTGRGLPEANQALSQGLLGQAQGASEATKPAFLLPGTKGEQLDSTAASPAMGVGTAGYAVAGAAKKASANAPASNGSALSTTSTASTAGMASTAVMAAAAPAVAPPVTANAMAGGGVAGQSDRDPRAAQDASGASTDGTAVHAAGERGNLPETPGIAAARLLQSFSRSEMQVHVDGQEFGRISVHAAYGRDSLAAQITLEHPELSSALAFHVPAMEQKLGADHGLRTTVTIDTQTGAGTGGSAGGGADTPTERRSARPSSYQVSTGPELPATPGQAPYLATVTGSSTRLDIRI